MGLRLLQVRDANGDRRVAVADATGPGRLLRGVESVYDLAREALAKGDALSAAIAARTGDETIDLEAALAEARVLAPIHHPDPAHLVLSGTGLTHLGSAEGRDKMHKPASGAHETDSMRMFRMGQEGGKPATGQVGVQPEWFYKGDGGDLVGPGGDLLQPDFAEDGGEEPEIAGVYLIDDDGAPVRLGFCLANEFSDHVIERGNYLWLAHSKLRTAGIGPELLLGDLPDDVSGVSRIRRASAVVWEKPFVSGEANMSHAIGNLEHHHFKYAGFRRPGDVHVHFFGTATLSFSDGFRTEPGDTFEIEAPPFRFPLRNTLRREPPKTVRVRRFA